MNFLRVISVSSVLLGLFSIQIINNKVHVSVMECIHMSHHVQMVNLSSI